MLFNLIVIKKELSRLTLHFKLALKQLKKTTLFKNKNNGKGKSLATDS